MSSLSLPPEIISRVCRHLGMQQDSYHRFSHYLNDELLPLRITCRDLYSKTTFDAAVRYGCLLEALDIDVNHSGLCDLLHITQIPAFRKRIRPLRLHSPGAASPPKRLKNRWTIAAFRGLALEDMTTLLESSETVHLFAQCFRNLKQAPSLKEIIVDGPDLYGLVPAALTASEFPRKIAIFKVLAQHVAESGYRSLTQTLEDCMPYAKGIIINAPGLAYTSETSINEKLTKRKAK